MKSFVSEIGLAQSKWKWQK